MLLFTCRILAAALPGTWGVNVLIVRFEQTKVTKKRELEREGESVRERERERLIQKVLLAYLAYQTQVCAHSYMHTHTHTRTHKHSCAYELRYTKFGLAEKALLDSSAMTEAVYPSG